MPSLAPCKGKVTAVQGDEVIVPRLHSTQAEEIGFQSVRCCALLPPKVCDSALQEKRCRNTFAEKIYPNTCPAFQEVKTWNSGEGRLPKENQDVFLGERGEEGTLKQRVTASIERV